MTPAKVNVFIALFAYGGNGGTSSIIPEIAIWLTKTYHKMKQDPKIGDVAIKVYSDTPITMTRNRAVRDAQALGYAMLLMLDSDNEPDAYLGHESGAKPFWDSSFTFAYDRLMQGLPTVIAAPYCGPPPNPCPPPGIIDHGEVPYLFEWTNTESDAPDCQFRIDILTRLEASRLKGIYPVAALPTGVCLFTLNCFEGMKKPYFRYEMNEDGSEKRSTEDVVATRDISLFWQMTKGITAIWANCDAWAFHHKPKKVGKPKMVYLEAIGEEMREAILTQRSALDAVQYVDFEKGMPEGVEVVKPLTPPPGHEITKFQDMVVQNCMSEPPLDISKLPRKWDVLRPDQNHVYISDEEFEEARLALEKELAEESEGRELKAMQTAVDRALEIEEGVEFTDYQVHDPDYTTVTTANTPEHSNGDGLVHKMSEPNGMDAVAQRSDENAVTHRMIGNRKVAVIGAEIPQADLEQIQGLTSWVSKGDPIDALVVHPGSGQAAAAIYAELPEGSHLYAFDSVNTYQFKTDYADQFTKSFQPEMEQGKVLADLHGRKFPYPATKYDLDLVFIERALNSVKLNTWKEHVRPGGMIAGLGYSSVGVKRLIDEFAENKEFKAIGDVWAVRL